MAVEDHDQGSEEPAMLMIIIYNLVFIVTAALIACLFSASEG